MRALRFHSKGDIRLDDVEQPKCAPHEVRLKVAYCGVCGTDIHEYLDGPILLPGHGEQNLNTGAKLPLILGHEFSGVVVEVGKNVKSVPLGQRVVVNPAMDDRHHSQSPCEICVRGRHNICLRSAFYGLQAPQGGFADEICVDAIACFPLPSSVSLKLAALVEPLAVAAHMIRISGFTPGQDIVISGAGPIGSAIVFLLRQYGAGKILVSEIAPSRSAQAMDCGADKVINPVTTPAQSVVSELMGPAGADIAFDACGLQTTLDAAFACTKPGGTVFNVAIHEKPLSLNLNFLTLSEKRLLAGNAYTAEDYNRVIEVLKSKGAEVEKFITAVVPLEQAVDGAFEELVRNKAMHNKILVEVNGEDCGLPSTAHSPASKL
ncbi:hypothetical protein LTR86_001284 [Recurvomyces mirabilis]|nr:hypothetical protein LTR86_001284 [Recurvomyces mirabilis]